VIIGLPVKRMMPVTVSPRASAVRMGFFMRKAARLLCAAESGQGHGSTGKNVVLNCLPALIVP
jgi:hypothetical protein